MVRRNTRFDIRPAAPPCKNLPFSPGSAATH